jgi:hypothetical protein
MSSPTTSDPAIGELPPMPNTLWGEHPCAYHVGFIPLAPGVSFDDCEGALRAVARHHDMLRLRMSVDDGRPTYFVPPDDDSFTLHRIDVSGESAKDAAVDAAIAELKVRFENARGPFSLFAHCHYGDNAPGRLVVMLDHIVFDNFGLTILEDHVRRVLARRTAGQPIELPAKTVSYREWGQRMVEYVHGDEGRRDLAYWRSRPWDEVAKLKPDFPSGRYDNDNRRRMTFALPRDLTRPFLEAVRKRHGAQIMDVLLTAFVHALRQGFEMDGCPLSIAVILSERLGMLDGVNASRSLGNFATSVPAVLDSGGIVEPLALLKRICGQLREMPRGGKSFRYLAAHAPGGIAMKASDVLFNYLGQVMTPAFVLEDSDAAAITNPPWPRELPLDRLMRWPEYALDGLSPGAPYVVRCHFVEPVCEKPGERLFDIWINVAPVLRKFDILKEAGARDRVLIKEFACHADESGRLAINFVSYHMEHRAIVSALEVLEVDDSGARVPVRQINAGGPTIGPFQEDGDSTGGMTFVRPRPVDTTHAEAPAPAEVYETERYYYVYTELNVECQLYERELQFLVKYSGDMFRPERIRWFADCLLDMLVRLS